jgi:RNA polymerase sigma factor (sigma-70 family)
MPAPEPHHAIDAIFRIESARLIAGLARMVRDVGVAEELAQDAFVAALERWPESGVPVNPGAWLMATAKHRAIDLLRRRERLDRRHQELDRELDTASGGDGGDDLLRLVLISCHPVLATEARVALTLRLVGGLTTEEIARAFLVPRATVAQRIVRAKRTLSVARVPFEVPEGAELAARLAWRRSPGPSSWGARSAPTRSRPRSPPATPGRAPRRRPTGRASRRSTTPSPSSRPPRSWSSTAGSPWRWPSARRRASRSSTR